MNRKLHNTASALMVSSLVLALAALGSDPAALPAAPAGQTAAATSGMAVMGLAEEAASTATGSAARINARRIRQSMAMPFFSFATRG